jgi:AcrR family transcriptional regulator
MTRKQMEHQSRQQFVLTATRKLLMEKGIENASMEDIATEAEYTRRTLYAYFNSRDEILLMVFTEDLAHRWAEQRKAIQSPATGLEKIVAWGKSFYEYAGTYPHCMHLQIYWDFKGIDRDRIGEEAFASFESINNSLAEGLREIFRLGVADGSLRPDINVDLCISQYLYTLRSVLHRALSPTYSFASFDADEYVAHYLDLFTRAISNS